ncbi:hypothetical protein [Nostoc sp. TCL26-01]|uniref:hypothetical protein n=1 Tax=Nostoc sp. TCL26-01 TaxID=2576904 RepID=UPI0015BE4587|nr:hypothetical protein [Nostoc sp. TCL26-01]QLE55672.1 hypothetical protein FD725_09170 [Nostoc sp. TCL26-01]
MKISSVVLSVLRPVRFLIVAFTCALLLLSNTVPAFAIGTSPSDPTKATDQLLETQKETDKVARSAPPGLKEVQKKSNEGLNEVQGAADIDKQKRPENSQNATTVEGEIQNLLEKATGKK